MHSQNQWEILTSVQLREGPLSAHERSCIGLLLLLPQSKIGLVLLRFHSVGGKHEADLVAIALVLAIHEDEERDPRRNVMLGLQVYRERHVGVRNGDESLDMAIAVPRAILFELRVA